MDEHRPTTKEGKVAHRDIVAHGLCVDFHPSDRKHVDLRSRGKEQSPAERIG